MQDFIIELDTQIFLYINSFHAPYWDVVMKMATGKAVWGVMYLALLYALWRTFGWKTMIVMLLMAVLAVAAADQITASLLRPMFERLRPANPDNPISHMVHIVNNYRAGRYGFPSSHASNTFAVATLMSLVFWRRRFSFFIIGWAIFVCYSRIYLGVHYPGDLIVGSLIGVVIGALCYVLGRGLTKAWRGDLAPRHRAFTIFSTYDGRHFRYHPIDVVIIAGCTTAFFIVLDATAL